MTKVIKEEFEKLGLLEIDDDLFTYDTQLGMIFNEFNILSEINDDLFTYKIEVPKPTQCVEQTINPTHNDLEEHEWRYAEAVILINKILVRLIDVTVEQWLNLKRKFKEYLDIKRQREIYAREVDMEYNPSNLEFAKWLALKFYNHLEMDWAFKEFNYLLQIDSDVLTKDNDGFKTYEEYKDDWTYDGINTYRSKNLPGAYIVRNTLRYQDLEWYEALKDGRLKDEALKNKAIMEGIISEDEESHNKAWKIWDDYEDTTHNHEINDYTETDEEICNLFNNTTHNASVYKIRRFEMIKYSFGQDEEYVAIKECEYDDLTTTKEDACRAYQEIFRSMDEGWMVTRAE
ncbi:hypothetical protein Tco_1043154 [Tanacetum coccineum]|uniref:Uncharacterized protein n=1 Tax=Tanacetum coccineum TaxID=301880 RepID=A0ABQ5GML1_9ASTR